MGEVVLAAKVCHVPSMYLSELPGKHHGCRAAAIAGHKEIGRRARELGADTAVVFDVHWLVNSGYHVNNGEHFSGVYTSNELPHFIKDMVYHYPGCPELGQLIAEEANAAGVRTLSHNIPSLELEYGTLVPMRYMHMDVPAAEKLKVISIAAW
ncbi:DODA-type extradiol aromatic ring-opening family dioxygenase, partial [Pseudomonas sp. P5_A2_2]